MEQIVFTDPAVTPDEELVFAQIGDNSIYWKTIEEYLYRHHSGITQQWRFYNDGKCWLFRYLKKEKTVCWISVLAVTFRVGFWLSDKAEPLIEQSELAESVKEDFRNAKRTKIGRGLSVLIKGPEDVENAIKVMELKFKIK
ncbi:MAG TPA: DUF3788 family protein [Prolixibacteraceae bacterium]|nr:DUF3788 family protein [Prolixibacteraceae bacterium]